MPALYEAEEPKLDELIRRFRAEVVEREREGDE
jgi:hypothetical protein